MIFSFPLSQLQGFSGGLHWRTWLRIRASFFLHPHLNLEFRFAEQTVKILIYPASWVRKFTPPTQSQAEGGKLWAGKMSEFFEVGQPAGPAKYAFPHGAKNLREGRRLWTVLQDSVTQSSKTWPAEHLWLWLIEWATPNTGTQREVLKGQKLWRGAWTFLSHPQDVKSEGTELSTKKTLRTSYTFDVFHMAVIMILM